MTLASPTLDDVGHDWPYRHASRFVDHPAGKIHVVVAGVGPPILLVHGAGASSHSFRGLIPLLVPRFTVVAVDLPGQGLSSCHEAFEPTVRGVASVLADVVAELGLAPRIVVGHSAGAAVAVVLALDEQDDVGIRRSGPGRARVELVVGISAALLPLPGLVGAVMRGAARVLARSELAARLLAWRARMPGSVERLVHSTGSVLDDLGIDLYRRLAGTPGHVAGVLRMLATWDPETALDALPRLDTEVLLIAGADDRATPADDQRSAAARLPRVVLHVVERAGHLVHEEAPGVVAQLIHDAAERAGLGAAPADGGLA